MLLVVFRCLPLYNSIYIHTIGVYLPLVSSLFEVTPYLINLLYLLILCPLFLLNGHMLLLHLKAASTITAWHITQIPIYRSVHMVWLIAMFPSNQTMFICILHIHWVKIIRLFKSLESLLYRIHISFDLLLGFICIMQSLWFWALTFRFWRTVSLRIVILHIDHVIVNLTSLDVILVLNFLEVGFCVLLVCPFLFLWLILK